MKMRTWQDLNNVYLEKFDQIFGKIADYRDRFGEYPETIEPGFVVSGLNHREKEIWFATHTGSFADRLCREVDDLASMEESIKTMEKHFSNYVGFLKQQEEETKEVDELYQRLAAIRI